MPYTKEEGGRLNNFAAEPKMYIAEPPTKTEQRNYLITGVGALALVTGAIAIVFSIS